MELLTAATRRVNEENTISSVSYIHVQNEKTSLYMDSNLYRITRW